jgi:signal transduction histidine kinase
VRRVERIASTDALRRTALDLGAAAADRAAYVSEAAPLAKAQGLDFLDIVAADGTIVSSAEWPARFGYKHPWAAERPSDAAGSSAFLQAVELPRQTALGLMAVRPIVVGDRRIYLAGGRVLDQQFLRSLVLPPGMRALLSHNIEPERSHPQVIDDSGNAAEASELEPLLARVRESAREAQETVVWPDGPEIVDAMPLTGRDQKVLGVLLVASSGRELAALISRIRWTGVVFGGLGIVFGVAVSYAVAARVTRPVEQLADAARAIAGGDWAVPAEIDAAGEIQALANAFDTMTRQLVDQRERLLQAERVAAWRELARRLAHELKNPLFPLRITIDNLQRAKTLPPAEFDEVFTESMTTLATGLASLNTVIGRFSDFAKIPAPEFEQVALNEIVERAVRLFQAQVNLPVPGRAPISVTLDLDPTIGAIRADPEQLGRVCQNLLLNAIDAMPAGGEVAVRTRSGDASVRLDVADTGQGLTEEERKRLFTPYYTTKQHGTGLGLAIVQAVVADHAGKIWAESEPGRGTTFHIELPVIGACGHASTRARQPDACEASASGDCPQAQTRGGGAPRAWEKRPTRT